MNFYYFSLCHLCKKPSDSLKKCSQCKVPYYCTKTHQLLDWSNHKSLCKAVTNTSKFRSIKPGCSPQEFNEYKYTFSLLWRYELGRDLEFVEQQMWMFPKVCSVCFTPEADLLCRDCLSAAYCSVAHQRAHYIVHKLSCNEMKLCLLVHQISCLEELDVTWVKFKISPEAQAQGTNLEETVKFLGYARPHELSKKEVDYVIMTEYFCPVFNLIYPLELTKFVEKRHARKSTLIIHIVGPSAYEEKISWILIVEYFSHWISNLTQVKVFLVGPDVIGKEDTTTISLKCQDCKDKNFLGTIVKVRGLYHDHINLLPRPDLVVAFNSGLHEFVDIKCDTWKKTLPKLTHYKGVPTMLTAYTEDELKRDVARFRESSVNFIVKPQRNPFSSLRPNRNWEEGFEPVFYQNGYVAIITKK